MTELTTTPTMKYYPELSPDNEWAAFEEQTSLDNGNSRMVIGRVRTGLTDIHGPDAGPSHPLRFEFAAPMPNPAHAGVTFRYAVPVDSRLTLSVYDAAGRLIAKPVCRETRQPGWYRLNWNRQDRQGERVANGVYFCRLQRLSEPVTRDSRPEVRTHKLVLE